MEALEIISRTMFCPKCSKAERPNSTTYIVLYGSTRGQYYFFQNAVYVPLRRKGFTPHIIRCFGVVPGVKGDKVFMDCDITCGVHGCGTKIEYNEQTYQYDIYLVEPRIKIFTEKDYAVLRKRWKDTGYELEGLDG